MATIQYGKPKDDEIPWQQRLVNYSQNPNAGRDEYQRAVQAYRARTAIGDTDGAGAAKRWSDQVNTAIGGVGSQPNDSNVREQLAQIRTQATQVNPQITAMRQALQERVSRPADQFQYDPNKDQAFQAQKAIIAQDTQRDMNNARVEAGASGMRGGSLQNNQLMQLAAKNQSRLQNEVLPNSMAQAYQQYRDRQSMDQQQTGNMMQMANMVDNQDQQQFTRLAQSLGLEQGYNQQQTDNQFRTEQQQIQNQRAAMQDALQQRQANLGAAATVGQQKGRVLQPKDDWGNLFNQTDAPINLQAQQLQYAQQQDSIQNARAERGENRADRQLDATLANMTSDNARQIAAEARAAGNDQRAQLFDIWDRTGSAPAGIAGVAPGTPIAGKQAAPQTAETYSKYIESVAIKDDEGKLTNPDAVEDAILLSDLDDYEKYKLYKTNGLKWDGAAPQKK